MKLISSAVLICNLDHFFARVLDECMSEPLTQLALSAPVATVY